MEGSPSIADKLARLAQLEADFQRALDVEKLEALAEFAAGAGHEINNPLTVISGRAQLLLREETDPERQHALALISAQAMRVYEMIADMMLFARPPRPDFQSVELIALVDHLVADFVARTRKGTGPICRDGPESASHKLDLSPLLPGETAIRRSGESGPILIEADPVQLNVALRAICQNSLEALQSGGHIEIQCSRHTPCADKKSDKTSGASTLVHLSAISCQGETPPHCNGRDLGSGENFSEAQIRITDDGPGIAPEERRHIFDPFYSARQAGRGLGLGLSKAWRIITNHGGRIEVESQPGHGATFIIILPAKQERTSDRFL